MLTRLGGGWTHQHPAPSLIAQARYALEVTQRLTGMQEPLLYARVDGIVIDGVLHLMELEVNEPGLMLDADAPRGPERFAEAIVQVIVSHKGHASARRRLRGGMYAGKACTS